MVRTFTGAWIETTEHPRRARLKTFAPSRVRGLKRNLGLLARLGQLFAPSRVRGLKHLYHYRNELD